LRSTKYEVHDNERINKRGKQANSRCITAVRNSLYHCQVQRHDSDQSINQIRIFNLAKIAGVITKFGPRKRSQYMNS